MFVTRTVLQLVAAAWLQALQRLTFSRHGVRKQLPAATVPLSYWLLCAGAGHSHSQRRCSCSEAQPGRGSDRHLLRVGQHRRLGPGAALPVALPAPLASAPLLSCHVAACEPRCNILLCSSCAATCCLAIAGLSALLRRRLSSILTVGWIVAMPDVCINAGWPPSVHMLVYSPPPFAS